MTQASVSSVNISRGGVPKRPVLSALLGPDGIRGDRQRDLRFHGGPDRAVCVYSLELIEALQAEGHPIAPGTIGENLTLTGIDWQAMAPGARLEVGPALLQLTAYAAPCRKIARSFVDEMFVRVSQKTHPGWSRLYARVLRAGEIAAGTPAILVAPP
jgi:MOSC domain-containing protein YiiM